MNADIAAAAASGKFTFGVAANANSTPSTGFGSSNAAPATGFGASNTTGFGSTGFGGNTANDGNKGYTFGISTPTASTGKS